MTDYKGRCGLYYAILRKEESLILYWLEITEIKQFKKITFDGVNILTIARIYLKDDLYLRNSVSRRVEELDEGDYIKKHSPAQILAPPVEMNDMPSEVNEMNAELLKLKRKLILGKTASMEKKKLEKLGLNIPVLAQTPLRTARKGKLFEFNYDLSKMKPKIGRRASINTLWPEYKVIIPQPLCENIEVVPVEPFTL